MRRTAYDAANSGRESHLELMDQEQRRLHSSRWTHPRSVRDPSSHRPVKTGLKMETQNPSFRS